MQPQSSSDSGESSVGNRITLAGCKHDFLFLGRLRRREPPKQAWLRLVACYAKKPRARPQDSSSHFVGEAPLTLCFDFVHRQLQWPIQGRLNSRTSVPRTTIRTRIVSEFNRHQEHVIEVLQRAPGHIHFAFDGWRSKNRKNVYGLACFFRDEQTNQPRKIILGMPEVAGCHAGDTIGSSIVKLINVYNIGNKTGYFTLDNTSNMDTAMEFIGNVFDFDGRRRRGRCFGHVLNLAAKALLNHCQMKATPSINT
ncbi:PIF1-like helicase domain-containing protein [Apiospora marii]|uniref:PIF1-like helicase domain-containing protein n=1 Tax=Apiospora marii TaxID=335849 RepID=UPI00312ED67B